MVYEDENNTRDKLFELRKSNVCAVCKGRLDVFMDFDANKAFLACSDWYRTHHEGIEREASRYEKEGLASLNIPTRREIMEKEYGIEKTRALDRYIDTAAITKSIATEIVETLWGGAPLIEKTKAILLCQTYQLNPLIGHIYLVGYRRRDKAGEYIMDRQGNYVLDWSLQIGIGATRLMAQRKHNYSYIDMTPRKAAIEEIDKILGDTADPNSIYGFVHIKDVATGAEAFGLRGIPKNERIKGEDKGNTHLNMACIRAERLALDRQYPGEMPQAIALVDERYEELPLVKVVEGEVGGKDSLISQPGGDEKIDEPPPEELPGEEVSGETVSSSPKAAKSPKIGVSAAEAEGFHIDLPWLDECLKELKWSVSTAKTFVVSQYKVSPQGTLEEVMKRLTREQAEEFVKEIQERTAKKQFELFS